MSPTVSAKVRIYGKVQGVWFRAWTVREAGRLALRGWVRNCADGSVEAVFHGADSAVREMIGLCRVGPSAAQVERIEEERPDALLASPRVEPPVLPLPDRGVAVPVDEPPPRLRDPWSSDRRGASIEDKAGEGGETYPLASAPPTYPPPPPPELVLPALDPPPPPPPLATADPPPSLRGTADPVVFPLDVRSCAEAITGNPATANAMAQVTRYR